jgi:hypothetical protein
MEFDMYALRPLVHQVMKRICFWGDLNPFLPTDRRVVRFLWDTVSHRSWQSRGCGSLGGFVRGCLVVLMLWVDGASEASGQSSGSRRFFYAIEEVSTGTVVRRGYASEIGIPSNELILAPNSVFRAWMFDSVTGRVGEREFTTPSSGSRFNIPRVPLGWPVLPDTDGDGLSDDAEFVVGTEGLKADSDGDGITDGVEVTQGQNPLDGQPVVTGLIASARVTGTALDVSALNDVAAVACGAGGVALFSIANPFEPVLIAQLDTPGTAHMVASGIGFVAVADGPGGLVMVDLSDPADLRLHPPINLGGSVLSVESAGGMIYAGIADGRLVIFDPISRLVLHEVPLTGAARELAVVGQQVFALTGPDLLIYDVEDGELHVRGRLRMADAVPSLREADSLFVGGGVALVGFPGGNYTGFATIDVSDPTKPRFLGSPRGGQLAVHQVVSAGSGLLLAVTGFGNSSTFRVSMFDIRDPQVVTNFVTSFDTPGTPRAVAIVNGLGYIADGEGGLQVLNYLAYDAGGIPPAVEVDTSFPDDPPRIAGGDVVTISARVSDDVQVRSVEIYVDGVRLVNDASFPFEHTFPAPALGAGRSSFTFRVRATDTGGNDQWTPETTVALVPDIIPPRLKRFTPGEGAVVDTTDSMFAIFNELLDPASLSPGSMRLTWAGPDHRLDTADDLAITNATVTFRDAARAVVWTASRPLINGRYGAVATTAIRDVGGNAMTNEVAWSFWVLSGGPIGDADSDGIFNTNEVVQVFNPTVGDTDGDGWTDSVELAEATAYVTNPDLRPGRVAASFPSVQVKLPGAESVGETGIPVTVALPRVQVKLPGAESVGGTGIPVTVALPPVQMSLPAEAGNP